MFKRSLLSLCLAASTLTTPVTVVAQESKPTTVYNIKGNLPDLKFELQGLNRTVKTEDLQGKVALVFFWLCILP